MNVVSLALLAKEFKVCYDSAIDNVFYAYKEDVGCIRFQKDPKTLTYTLNVNKYDKAKVLSTLTNVVTVKDRQNTSPT